MFHSTFPSFRDITNHTDQLKFALPLSDDIFSKVDLICDKLCYMKDIDLGIREHTMPLILMTRELNVDDWWHNRFFSMVTELPLRIQSRWYIFERFISPSVQKSSIGSETQVQTSLRYEEETPMKENSSDILCANSTGFTSEKSQTCGLIVGKFHGQFDDILTAISNLKQTITYLHLPLLVTIGVNTIKFPMVGLDPAARCVQIGRALPLHAQIHLGEQLLSCDELEYLSLPDLSRTAPLIVSNLRTKPNLTHLDLGCCSLSDDLCIILCKQLRFLHHLKHLELSKNHIGSEGAEYLAKSIRLWTPEAPLKELHLLGCNIRVPGAEELTESLAVCSNLEKLTLSENQITPSGVKNLAHFIRSLGSRSRLTRLCLEDCGIDASSCSELMEALASCGQLRDLSISLNPIGGSFEATNPYVVYPELEIVNVCDESLTEGDIKAIAAMINNQGLPRLHTLELGYYHISSDLGLRAPEMKTGFAEMLKNESDDMLRALRTIIEKVPYEIIMTQKTKYKSKRKDDHEWEDHCVHVKFYHTEEVVKQEEDRRRTASNAK